MGSFLASAECADADGAGPGASPDGGSPDVQQVVSPRQTALDCKQFLREAAGPVRNSLKWEVQGPPDVG